MRVDVCGPDGVVKTATLDAGGRATLLPELVVGAYELSFHAGAYQAAKFYDVIPVRFNITDAGQHYHIPLILSPFGYSTYRGG
jgi:5-hydroxyisourate hydrolase